MKFTQTLFILAGICLLLSSQIIAQKDSSHRWLQFSVDGAAIVSSTFTDFEDSYSENYYPYYANYITRDKKAPEYSIGYYFGFTSLWGRSRDKNFVLSISVSSTKARSHESYYYNPHSLGPDAYKEHSELDFSWQSVYANVEMGYRFRIHKHFLFQPSFVLLYDIQTRERQTGTKYIESQSENTSVFPPVFTYSNNTQQIDQTTFRHGRSQGSIRFNVFYEFRIKKRNYNVFVFKNFGLKKYHLAWGGIGASIYL